MPAPFTVHTYNVLAPEYADHQPGDRDFYALTRAFVPWERRAPLLAERLRGLDSDLLCLQEVSQGPWNTSLREWLERCGYVVAYQKKRSPTQPDGLVVAARAERFDLADVRPLSYADGTGYVGLVVDVKERASGEVLRVASAHLKWTPDSSSQVRQLKALLVAVGDGPGPRLVCGDFNFRVAEHEVWKELEAAGWHTTHPDPAQATWASDGRADKLDAILFTEPLSLQAAFDVPVVEALPGLPSAIEPSDHVPVGARLAWASDVPEQA